MAAPSGGGEDAASPASQDLAEVDLLTEKDLYKILGVPRSAKLDDIKKAYKKRSLKYHPDKNQGDPEAKEKFQRIAEAMSVLSDSKKRLKYDKSGDMDLEDFDMDHFMNMWVSEMMEDGGVVDDMMKEVLPWRDDEDKMRQFMEENTKTQGKKVVCAICGTTTSNKRLMLAHFEQKHQYECEDWANDTLKSMKASFESFMQQLTGIGDGSGEFVLPDGSKAGMQHVKGVPDIRGHMQKRLDKAKHAEAVLEMYRKVDADGSTYTPTVEEVKQALGVEAKEAEALRQDKEKLLRKLKVAIDKINEEDDEEELLASMGGGMPDFEALGGLDGFGAGGGKFGGKGGFPGMLGGMGGLEALLSSEDPAALEMMMAQMGGLGDLEGLLGGAGGPGGGLRGGGGLLGGGGMPMGMGRGGGATASRAPAQPSGPSQDIGCKCGYSCGTMKALEKHLDRFKGDPAHEALITERPPSPPRERPPAASLSASRDDDLDDIPPELLAKLSRMPPHMAERLGLGGKGRGY
eukprot:TRINITY_DN14652_c0_g3_i1.p1 TRINITY_DN14652_c0_g3~~TRINITY_DN14652_c0_g3_i1.p1  ORF type:complete len:518 (-),score=206.30 TRINITY_DN14652_c0_g3_i1:380-1933(-)